MALNPPLIVFEAKNMWKDWVARPGEGFIGTTHHYNKWLHGVRPFPSLFSYTLLHTFRSERPVLFCFVNGHVWHVERLINATRQKAVSILKLPPHSPHILQLLDLSVFKS